MNAKEQAHQISQAIVETQQKLHTLEIDRFWYPSKRDQIQRLKRVLRALDRDLDKIVATIPAPVQFDFFASLNPAMSALEDDDKSPSNWISDGELTPPAEVSGENQPSEPRG